MNRQEISEITYNEMRALFRKPRGRDAHKGDFGRVLVIAGSAGMAGAAILCARAALRCGSGLVTVSADKALFPILQGAVPEATCVSRSFSGALSREALLRYDAVAFGPGIGTDEDARALTAHVLEVCEAPLALDADGLNCVALMPGGADVELRGNVILTPHAGEAARLLGGGSSAEDVQAGREAAALALARKYRGAQIVLKGAGTLVASAGDPDGMDEELFPLRVRVNTTGNPGMATGGSGDVLTGVIASLLGQGFPPRTAAAAGVYIHGLAGDLMAAEFGERGLTAGDLPRGVALALRQLAE